jgi:hypothetical protein
MRLALAMILTLLTGCVASRFEAVIDPESGTDQASDQSDSSWTEERKALYQKAREGLRRSRERYIATTRPILQRKFRDEYPSLTDTEIEALVNDALENGIHQETGRRPDGPIRQPAMDCMASPWGGLPNANCY